MNEEKMREEFEQWRDESPNQRYGCVVWEAWQAACESRQKETDRLRALLSDATDMVEEWGAYASSYFQEKWGLEKDIARLREGLK